jgi:hypothetical protein
MADVALGIRPHSGWAVLVAVSPRPDVRLVHRARIDVLADGDPKQPWHAAQDARLGPDDAAALATRVAEGARTAADRALAEATAAITAGGDTVVAAAIVGEPRDLPEPARILASHALLHSAEGDLYFSALADAAEAMGLEVLAISPRAVSVEEHAELLADLGRGAGPPWRVDHKLAVVAALTALG